MRCLSPVTVLKLCERCGKQTDDCNDDPYDDFKALCYTCAKIVEYPAE